MTDKVLRLAPQTEILRNTDTQNTVVFDSYTYKLSVKATPCGLDVSYTRELTEKERKAFSTSIMAEMFLPKEHTLVSDHIHPKWWWKFLFRTTESELKRFIKETQETASEFQKNKDIVQRLGI